MTGAIVHVVGARPNFMKVAPVHAALAARGARQLLVHTGQHYDANMSGVFFAELGIPAPDINLEVGSASHAVQTARIMTGFEDVVRTDRPAIVLVYGDVNSTVAAALVCAKLGVPVGHVEAGLRSRDRTMPEEINRLVTDQLSDLLFTPSADADANLVREGIARDKVHFVGNVMIDTLVRLLPIADRRWQSVWVDQLAPRYGLVTLHRPSNVDESGTLAALMAALIEISRELPLVFPIHPRTRERIHGFGLGATLEGIDLREPLGYTDFLALQQHASLVITDSGGVQEETTFLGVPCLTVRDSTERPVTVTVGTNTLVGTDPRRLVVEGRRVLGDGAPRRGIPPLWDGHAGERVAQLVVERCAAPD